MARLLLIAAVILFSEIVSSAQQVSVKKVPVTYVTPVSGQQMYVRYCAACHGADAKGDGPAAAALKAPPADLTALSRNNRGQFPALHVQNTILRDGGTAAHKDMPDWAALFLSLGRQRPGTEYEVLIRAANLTRYVKSVQESNPKATTIH
jgi:mono/diheme cytochrome c family protein